MGTNYYLLEDPCEHCGRTDTKLHIGKSSIGWTFGLHVDPVEGLNSLDDWKQRWNRPNARIVDEYGDILTPEDMLDLIIDRGRPDPVSPDFDYERNHAEPGPNNLVRRRISNYCVGHGDGPWDHVPGYFR